MRAAIEALQSEIDRRVATERREMAAMTRFLDRQIRDRDIGAAVLVVLILLWVNDKFDAHNGLIGQMQTQAADEKVARTQLSGEMLRKDTFEAFTKATDKALSVREGLDDGRLSARRRSDMTWTRMIGVVAQMLTIVTIVTLIAIATHGFTS